jgi:hypothetical protein
MIQALKSRILTLIIIIPPAMGSVGMIFIVRRRNHRFKRNESAVKDW